MEATPGANGTTTYKIAAKYQFLGASEYGLADRGDATLQFRTGASLSIDLRGQAGS